MHPSVDTWIAQQALIHNPNDNKRRRILEVGSRDINGSVRKHFGGAHYHGIDMVDGDGVDEVANIEFGSWCIDHLNNYDIVVCTEMLEHSARPWLAVNNMWNVLRNPGGVLLLTTRGFGYGYHGYPYDYTRWSIEGITELVRDAGFEDIDVIDDTDPGSPGVFVVARA